MMAHPLRIVVAFAGLLAVSACTGSGVEPSSLRPLTAEVGQSTGGQLPPPNGAGEQTGTLISNDAPATPASQVAAINTNARVQFAPAIGVSAEAVPTLAARLRARAGQRGIAVASSTDRSTTHVMKGYFSAFTDAGETTVIYVWDVLDPAGNRLHRIQGQQKQPGSNGDGWSTVTSSTMEAIADRTIDELAVWLSASSS
ncbi:MAG: hypothetical protein WDZ83_15225 [Rhizobiaceae bacterium]